jgi:hypothetical protein
MKKASCTCTYETSAKFCPNIRRHMSEDGGSHCRHCCEYQHTHQIVLLADLNAPRTRLGRDLVSTSGCVRLESDRSCAVALLPFRNDVKQHVSSATGYKLQKNCSAQIAFGPRLSPETPCFASSAVHEGLLCIKRL